MSAQELKPCPACGYEKILVLRLGPIIAAPYNDWHVVSCGRCHLKANGAITKEAAFAFWNEQHVKEEIRDSITAKDAEIARLTQVIDEFIEVTSATVVTRDERTIIHGYWSSYLRLLDGDSAVCEELLRRQGKQPTEDGIVKP